MISFTTKGYTDQGVYFKPQVKYKFKKTMNNSVVEIKQNLKVINTKIGRKRKENQMEKRKQLARW